MGKIVVADGDPGAREALVELLESNDHFVHEASDGEETLDLVIRFEPEVLLLDITMPVLDGIAVLRALRAERVTKNLPVIIVSARGTPDDRAAAADLGVVDYIVKPWEPDEVLQRVEWALRGTGTVPAVPWSQSGQSGKKYSSGAQSGPAAGPKLWRSPAASGSGAVTPQHGGLVESEGGLVRVAIPPGAVRTAMVLDASIGSEEQRPGDVTLRLKLQGNVADVTFTDRGGMPVEGVRLMRPATISFKYDAEDVQDDGSGNDLAVLNYNAATGQWVGMKTSVDQEFHTATVTGSRFPRRAGAELEAGKVLIVEDNDAVRVSLTDALEGAGYEVVQDSGRSDVTRRVLQEQPQVVILGLNLPRISGLQVLRQLKGNPATRAASVIMVGSDPHSESDTLSTLLSLGARDHIFDPRMIGDLQHRVRRASASARARVRQAERALARLGGRLGRGAA